MKKDAFYFPHFSNARTDRKLRRVRKELGIEGYGIFFMILEVLREQSNFKYPIEDIDLLADEFGTSEQKVRTVICNYNLFTLDKSDFFYSKNLISFMKPYLAMKEQRRLAGMKSGEARRKKSKNKELSFNGCSATVEQNANENEQSKVNKVKEIKESKKDKVKKINIKFDTFWNLYDKKVGKKEKIEDKWNKLKDEQREKAIEHIKKYKEAEPNKQYRKNPETYINNHSWKDEIIINNKKEEPIVFKFEQEGMPF